MFSPPFMNNQNLVHNNGAFIAMDFPPYHYYNHNHHDPTIMSVHTLLKPQAYQQPPFYQHPIPTSTTLSHQNGFLNYPHQHLSASEQYWASHPPFFHQQQTHTPISTAEIGSVLNQLLRSQQNFKHTLSLFANEISIFANEVSHLKTTLQPPPSSTQSSNQHHTPLSISTNLQTHKGDQETVHHQPPAPSFHSVTPQPQHAHLSARVHESVVTTQQNEDGTKSSPPSNLVTTIDIVEINVFSTSKTDEKCADTRLAPDLLCLQFSEFVKSFCIVTTHSDLKSPEKKDVVAVAATPQQHPHLTFELPAISIHIFDPGGKLTTAVNSAARRRQIRNFSSCNVFFFPMTAPSRNYLAPLPNLLWEPWDRGKKSCECMNNFLCTGGAAIVFFVCEP